MSAERRARDELVQLAAALYDRGLTPGCTGNLSVRVGDRLLLTPTGSCLGRLESERLCVIDAAGKHVDGDPPSKELPLHLALYDEHRNGVAVAHLHSTHAVAVSCLDGLDEASVLPPITPYFVMRVGRLRRVGYHPPGSAALEDAVRAGARDCRALLLANHGSLAIAGSLSAALDAVEEIEETARLFLLLADRQTSFLDSEAVQDLLGTKAAGGHHGH